MSRGSEADWLCSFFVRLVPLEAIVRILLGRAPVSATFVFRGAPPRSVLLDFVNEPARIRVDDATTTGLVRIAADASTMHRVLCGELPGGEAFGRRELLFRGSPADLARFIPLLGFAPLLYREHLADLGVSGFARPRARAGLDRTLSEDPMHDTEPSMPKQPWSRLRRGSEQALGRTVSRLAYAAGYGVGLLRHRYVQSLSLFDVLGELSRGVEDAASHHRDGRGQRGAVRDRSAVPDA